MSQSFTYECANMIETYKILNGFEGNIYPAKFLRNIYPAKEIYILLSSVAVSREFEARLRHAATGKLSLSTQQKMGTFFELGKDKAAKGEGWAPPFISCAQDTVGL